MVKVVGGRRGVAEDRIVNVVQRQSDSTQRCCAADTADFGYIFLHFAVNVDSVGVVADVVVNVVGYAVVDVVADVVGYAVVDVVADVDIDVATIFQPTHHSVDCMFLRCGSV